MVLIAFYSVGKLQAFVGVMRQNISGQTQGLLSLYQHIRLAYGMSQTQTFLIPFAVFKVLLI